MCFQEAVEASDKWGHFDGSTVQPTPADPTKVTDDEKKVIAEWDRDDKVACYLC
jgi:hypothetical protein